jgi:hypothetical protein
MSHITDLFKKTTRLDTEERAYNKGLAIVKRIARDRGKELSEYKINDTTIWRAGGVGSNNNSIGAPMRLIVG